MQAMILAAGKGKRMGSLTQNLPKPLLQLGSTTLIEHNIQKLYDANIVDIVVNTNYLGDKIIRHLKKYNIQFSNEFIELESAGGIINAFSLLDDEFIVINADVVSDYDISNLTLPQNSLAHLVLVENPEHNKNGDFSFEGEKYTFSGIGIYSKKLFASYTKEEYLPLATVLYDNLKRISFERYDGYWLDVGTPERLDFANKNYKQNI